MTSELPRAASSDPDDPRYAAWAAIRHARINVWLDGEPQFVVSTYDIDEGFVVRAVLTADGLAQIDPNDPELIWFERVEGVVTVAFGLQVGLPLDHAPID